MNEVADPLGLCDGYPHPVCKISKLTPPRRSPRECGVAQAQGAPGTEMGSCKPAGETSNQKDQDQLGSQWDTAGERGRWPSQGNGRVVDRWQCYA